MSVGTTVERLPSRWLAVVPAAAVVGFAFALEPPVGLGLTFLALGVVAWICLPVSSVAMGLLVLCYAPEEFGQVAVLGRPEIPKLVLLVALAVAAWQRGIVPLRALPVVAYLVAAVATHTFGHPTHGLTPIQALSSLVTLSLGWLAFAVAWDFRRDRQVLVVIMALPALCIAAGVALAAIGYTTVFSPDVAGGIPRLQGAAIPAQLALMAVAAVGTGCLWRRYERSLFLDAAIAANVAIAVLTVTRGAIVAMAILAVPFAARFVRGVWAGRRPVWQLVVTAIGGCLALVAVALLVSRRAFERYYVPGQGYVGDSSSGRTEEWAELVSKALEQPLLGHGIGAGPVLGDASKGFLNQHNEYLRLFLEAGLLGGGLVLLALLVVLGVTVARASRHMRPEVAAFVAALLVYALTDNPFSIPSAIVPWMIAIGMLAPGRPDSRGEARATP